MALTNPQYDAIMRMYNERQLRHQREQQEHIRIAYEKIPRLAEIDAEIASLSVRKAKAMLNGDASMDLDLNAAIRDRSQERAALLSMHGYPADYLELTYDCPLCRDTGYINGTQKCACFKKAAVDLLYRQSNVEELLKAGIDVYTTVNAQNIESLSDIAATIMKHSIKRQDSGRCV